MVQLDQGQRVEEVVEELQESDLEEEPVGWHSINSYFFRHYHHHIMVFVIKCWLSSSLVITLLWLSSGQSGSGASKP